MSRNAGNVSNVSNVRKTITIERTSACAGFSLMLRSVASTGTSQPPSGCLRGCAYTPSVIRCTGERLTSHVCR